MPAGSTQQPPIGLCRRQGRASRAQLLATSSCGVWLGPPALQMRLWGARKQLRKRVLAAPRWAQKSLVSACGGPRGLRRRLRRACTSATVSLGPLHYKAAVGGSHAAQKCVPALSRQPSALNSTESMPTAFKSRVVILGGGQASPGFPPSCADLSAECKLQPRAVAVKFHIKVQIHT